MAINSRRIRRTLVACTLAMSAGASYADEGLEPLKKECAQCHNLTGPSASTLADLRARKGPDLFYAGNKYQADWLEEWLQEPTRIRATGMYYGNHVKRGEKQDEIDEASIAEHPVLDASRAKAAATALMSLKGKNELVKGGEYKPGTISMSMGEMLFDKFRGCTACHEIEPGFGGLSGPEVYTAGARLQEDFMVSFMRDPHAWEPRAFMPNRHLSDADLQKLVHYLRALATEEKE